MKIDISKLFHQYTKNIRSKITSKPTPYSEWPESWKTVHIKIYPRFKTIKLPLPQKLEKGISDAVLERVSTRSFSRKDLDIQTLSNILMYSCGETNKTAADGRGRRAQASGGGLFPIETYILKFTKSDVLDSGIYHYNIDSHGLDILEQRSFSNEEISKLFLFDFIKDASCAIILTGIFAHNQTKYQDRGYRYTLLEAGGIGQNMYLVSSALSVGCVAIGGTIDDAIEEILHIDGVTESLVYSLVLGTIKDI